MALSSIDRQTALLSDPVNTEFNLAPDESEALADLLYRGSVSTYCVVCKQMSVFRMKSPGYALKDEAEKLTKFGLIIAQAECQQSDPAEPVRLCRGEVVVIFRRRSNILTKLAQHPTKADLDFGPLDAAMRDLPPDSRKELRRALGLRSHGVGIGSFVYLRRIFERLLEDAHQAAKASQGWDEEVYVKSRVAEKIKLLHSELPNRLVASANLYGVLSKGVHELSEEECLTNFDLVFQAIRSIAAEHHEDKEYARVIRDIGATAKNT